MSGERVHGQDEDILLELDDIECRYDDEPVIRGLSFRLRRGQVACLLGPSGCGKTTALRAIAGFEPVRAGEIRLAGEVISRPGYTQPPENRRLGMVFQDYALFPHLNIYENITFGLRDHTRAERRARADELLELVDMRGMGTRYPHELSGGQQQRVSLIRAVAPRPRLVLLDEPFSNLDVDLRERLAREVHDIFRDQGVTAILVTHDQHEAFAVADVIGLLKDGRIEQWDTPYNLYHEPASRFVAEFIGQGVLIPATLRDHNRLQTEVGTLLGNRAYPWPNDTAVDILLRPDDVRLMPESHLRARVANRAFKGAETIYTLRLESGRQVLALAPSHDVYPEGTDVGIRIDAQHLVAFRREEE
nr:ABC transporter ATP-binding protein [Alkalilimnicola ehrlichii]